MEMIKVKNFRPGMSIQATYESPSDGRVKFNLCDKQDNIVLHVNPRTNESALVLNTRSEGSWGKEERPGGFDFSAGAMVTVRVECQEEHFNILCNGKVIHKYIHRLPVETVKKITWETSADAKLISLAAGF